MDSESDADRCLRGRLVPADAWGGALAAAMSAADDLEVDRDAPEL